MYGGRLVEHGPVDRIFGSPSRPYAQALLAARPEPGQRVDELPMIPGSPPNPLDLPDGCAFWPRCPVRGDARCETEEPPLLEVATGHQARTFYQARAFEGSTTG